MPTSALEGKDWSLQQILSRPHGSVLDIGPGVGTYSDLLRGHVQTIDAVEIYEPYVDQYNLRNKYDNVHIGDFLDFNADEKYDWIILGDVLEHFTREDGEIVLKKAKELASYILLSCPNGYYPQGSFEGNDHEAHLSHYTFEEVSGWDGVEATWRGVVLLGAVIKS